MFQRFFRGRYGSDPLNIALIILVMALSLVNNLLYIFIGSPILYRLFGLVYTAGLVLIFFRMFSKNIYRRQAENQKFLSLWNRLKDRNHRYFRCPHCKQCVRVPRHKGKINIRCPRCGEKFIRKT
ncbi:MAG: hypothetical protein IKT58_01445 [Oscillospiraceae bacterium]|nr:hypothetical protein [Oscillospiraceae bacterium]